MLQQTQVATVIPYYERFLARFPAVSELAAADERDVLRIWEGLGYYRRARQLHAAAKHVATQWGGEFPRDIETVRRLPGIGRYTAGAILSLAFDARQPILEANTVRLFARLLAYRGNPRAADGQKLLWRAATAILPARGSGNVNQSLMELGSQICTPRAPRCGDCPLASHCLANRKRLQDVIPRPPAKPRIEKLREAAVVIEKGDRVLLVQRARVQRWGGLWDFPRFSVRGRNGRIAEELAAHVATACALRVNMGGKIASFRHSVTRFQITLDVFAATRMRRTPKSSADTRTDSCNLDRIKNASTIPFAQVRWVRKHELGNYPLSTTGRKIADFVCTSALGAFAT